GVDTPFSDAELNQGAFAGKFYVSAYNVGGFLSTLPFDPEGLQNLKTRLGGYLNALEKLFKGPILSPKLPLLGHQIKNAPTPITGIRAGVNELTDDALTPDAVKLALGHIGTLFGGVVFDPGTDDVQFHLHAMKSLVHEPVKITGSLGVPGLDLSI